jgi:hypothetical protein
MPIVNDPPVFGGFAVVTGTVALGEDDDDVCDELSLLLSPQALSTRMQTSNAFTDRCLDLMMPP